jgi:hypothetical protein
MEARRAKPWRSQGLVHDSRTPTRGQAQNRDTLDRRQAMRQKKPQLPRESGYAPFPSLGLESSATGCR